MAYLHIDNLYKNQTILLFKECYALEKIHGTSAHISWHIISGTVDYFSGGVAIEKFKELFEHTELEKRFRKMVPDKFVHVYGEAYGGNCQKMSYLYGPDLKFVAFDVKIGDVWLNVPKAEVFVKELGLEFVPYWKTTTKSATLNLLRDGKSEVVNRHSFYHAGIREGVVLRPLEEMTLNNGSRVIAKHKSKIFKES